MGQNHQQDVEEMVLLYEKEVQKRLNEQYASSTKFGDRLADRIASFGGSWKFIGIFTSFLLLWIIWNVLFFTKHFDEPPYILLNLILSFVASFQAPIIMMSQNRQASRDKQEAMIDFAINYRAEQEIDDMQAHLHRIESEIHELKQLILANNQKSAS